MNDDVCVCCGRGDCQNTTEQGRVALLRDALARSGAKLADYRKEWRKVRDELTEARAIVIGVRDVMCLTDEADVVAAVRLASDLYAKRVTKLEAEVRLQRSNANHFQRLTNDLIAGRDGAHDD